ncbi:MAG: YggT family protein [Gammaproteobacteria bacterium]|nr:YggT family protein [Gammaproteobacteria bacterium]
MADLFQFLITLYLYGFLVRLLLTYHQADFYNPLSQMLARVTDPLYRPVRRVMPSTRGWDLALLLIALALELISLFVGGAARLEVSYLGLVLYALTQIGGMALNIYLVSLIVVVIASWVQLSAGADPFLSLVRSLTVPILMRIRAVLPDTGILDLSPMVALFGLYFLQSGLYRIGQWGLIV